MIYLIFLVYNFKLYAQYGKKYSRNRVPLDKIKSMSLRIPLKKYFNLSLFCGSLTLYLFGCKY